ncbi:MAG: HAMP domain-containing histidine kinase [Oscillospiraceae bacterium]|nr:HAMP domain-containing histidine kinase [Oscillospiraceae bacterium]
MIRKLQLRFTLTAGVALLIVLASVIGVINATMRGIFELQTERVLNQLVHWDGETSWTDETEQRPELGTMLGSHFFRVLLDQDGNVLALDLTQAGSLADADAEALALTAYERGRAGGRLQTGYTYYAYRVSSVSDGEVSLIFFDCTPAMIMMASLLNVSLMISGISVGGFIIIFYLLSRRAVRPLIRNIEGQKRFITNASHELKTPLAIISANTELVEAMNGESEWTHNITSQVRRMTTLVNELVTLSKLSELEKITLRSVELSSIAASAADSIEPLVLQRGKALQRSIMPEVSVNGDERLLRMLVDILLDNAAKYCDEGGAIHLALEAKPNAKTAVLSVSNDYAKGQGVDYARFFERFYQEDASHNSGTSGFGIGLSTAQEIVTLLKGSIRVDWKDGRIDFRVTLHRQRG